MPRPTNNKKNKGKKTRRTHDNQNNSTQGNPNDTNNMADRNSSGEKWKNTINSLCPDERKKLEKALQDAMERKARVIQGRDDIRSKMDIVEEVLVPMLENTTIGTGRYNEQKEQLISQLKNLDKIIEGLDKLIAVYQTTLCFEDAVLNMARDAMNRDKDHDGSDNQPGGLGGNGIST